MKVRMIAMSVVLLVLSSSSFALIGTPTAELGAGQWSLGGNYQYSTQDLDDSKIKVDWSWIDYAGGGVDDEGSGSDSFKMKIGDLNINHYYGQANYGLSDSLEIFGRLGMTDIKAKTKEVGDDEWYGANLDNEFAYGIGAKYTFAKKEKCDWGVSLLMNWFTGGISDDGFEDEGGWTESWKDSGDIDLFGILVAVGPTVDMGGWKLYGGALFQMLNADYSMKETGLWEDDVDPEEYGTWIDKFSGDSDTNSLGAYIGAQFDMSDKYNMSVELMATQDGWGAGAGIAIPF